MTQLIFLVGEISLKFLSFQERIEKQLQINKN